MIQGALAVYYRELLILKYRMSHLIPSWAVSPLLYLIAFGYAMGRHVEMGGHTYIEFLIPGLVAMNSMTQAFSISSEINIARFYWHIFEEIQASPVSDMSYVAGTVLAGMTRGLLAAIVILVLGRLFGVTLSLNAWFWTAALLNSFVFASLAVWLAMVIRSHADQMLMTGLVITPMAFLGGTFFPLENFPGWAQILVELLPLTHAAATIRAAAFGQTVSLVSLSILGILGSLFFIIAVLCIKKAKD